MPSSGAGDEARPDATAGSTAAGEPDGPASPLGDPRHAHALHGRTGAGRHGRAGSGQGGDGEVTAGGVEGGEDLGEDGMSLGR
ncbi:hypothetical protein GCM10020369_43710 [Cryptosporangium minutisporangium]|uniref:Uncharacterized protein n=1 Tax=Cryptosporangium minutisporangium TaxID=113569 RepID=A0ABP6T1T5_9ACTN